MRISTLWTQMIPETRDQRTYAIASFVNTIGFGLAIPAVALYFTQVVGLTATQVGVGFSIAGAIALLASLPSGHLADRIGPLLVVRVTMALQAVAALAYLFITDFVSFVILTTIEMVVTSANQASIMALARRVGGVDAVRFRSQIQSLANVAMALGVALSAIAIQIGTPTAYRTVLAINAATFAIALIVLRRLPAYEALPQPEEGPRWIALSDKPFMAYAALAGGFMMSTMIMDLPLPIWIVERTDAPPFVVALLILVNTGIVVTMQMRIGSKVESVINAGAALRNAGLLLLLGCALIGSTAIVPGWWAVLALISAAVALSFAELWFMSGSFAFEFGLPPEHAQGQYQGVVGIGAGLGAAIAPAVLVTLCINNGAAGWLGLGALFAAIGAFGPTIAAWGTRTRTFDTETPATT